MTEFTVLDLTVLPSDVRRSAQWLLIEHLLTCGAIVVVFCQSDRYSDTPELKVVSFQAAFTLKSQAKEFLVRMNGGSDDSMWSDVLLPS